MAIDISYVYELPRDMREHWEWVCAIDAYYYCDPVPLAGLVRSSENIPINFRKAISEIISGEPSRKNPKAASKLKIPAAERMKLAADLMRKINAINFMKSKFLPVISDEAAREPIEIKRALEHGQRLLVQISARKKGLHPETLENLIRDLRKKIEEWPNV